MSRLVRSLAALALLAGMAVFGQVAQAGSASASNTCPGTPILLAENTDAAGNVVATSAIYLNAIGGTGTYCAKVTKVGSSVGVAHVITLQLWDEHNGVSQTSGTYTTGGPITSRPWLQHCARITVAMSTPDGTVVFTYDSHFINCVVN